MWGQATWKEKKYLEEEADEVDEPQPGISQEEEDEIRPLGIREAGGQVGDHGHRTGFSWPYHDDHQQEEQDFRFSHIQLTGLLRITGK